MLASGAKPPADIFARSAADRDLALSVDRAARLGRAADREGHRREDPARRPQVLSLQESSLHAGRVLGGGLPPRPLDGAPALSHNRVFNTPQDFSLFFTFSGLSGDIIGDLAAGAAASRRCPRNWIIDWRRFHELGASGGAAVNADAVAQARSLSGRGAAQPAGRRRQPGVPQPEARRQSRPAVGPGRGQAHEGQEPADARRDRLRQQRLDRRRRRQAAGPAYRDAALVLHPQGSQGPA